MAKRSKKRSTRRAPRKAAKPRAKASKQMLSPGPSRAQELASRAGSAAVAVGHATLDAMEAIVSVARGAAVAAYEAATPERRERAKAGAVRAAQLAGRGAGIVYEGAKTGLQKAHAYISARMSPSAAEVPMLEAINAASPKVRVLPAHHYLAPKKKKAPAEPAPAVVMVPARVSQQDIDSGAIPIRF